MILPQTAKTKDTLFCFRSLRHSLEDASPCGFAGQTIRTKEDQSGMAAYGDRCTISIKNFGRKIVIAVHRGTILKASGNRIEIAYHDAKTRNKPKGRRNT